MPAPLVSAIVLNHNGRDHLEECLDSLVAQTHRSLEILLVDNGSEDGSCEKARARYGDAILILENERNEGFAAGCNRGIRESSGEWIFLLNDDAVADPSAVEELMRFAASRPEVGMLACRVMRYRDPAFFDSTGLLIYPDGVSRPRAWQEKDLGQYEVADEVLAPHGAAAALRRSMLDEVGLFDEDYFAYLEDLDLGVRGQLAGWTCWYVPGARIRHHKSATAGNYSSFKAYHVERNRIWNAVKLMPRFILFMSPLFTINRYLMQFYAAATHRGLSDEFVKEYSLLELVVLMVRAYAAALWKLPRMLRKRWDITRRRKLTTEQWYALLSRHKLDAIEIALKY